MNDTTEENYLISHIDTDGVSVVVVAFLFGLVTSEDQVLMIDYADMYGDEEHTTANPRFFHEDRRRVYFTDLNIDPVVHRALVDYYGEDNCFFFDHHQDSLDFRGSPNCWVDEERCGTKLLYDYLRRGKRTPAAWDDYVNLVNVYDLWKEDDPLRPRSEDLNRVLYQMTDFYGKTTYQKYLPFIKHQLKKLRSDSTLRSRYFSFSDYEQHRIELAREKEDREYHYAQDNLQERVDSRGNKFLLYHGASKISYVCNRLLHEREDITYVIAVNTYAGSPTRREITGKISARSRGDFDCTTLAGVNGHVPAAGAHLDPEFVKELLNGQQNEIGFGTDE